MSGADRATLGARGSAVPLLALVALALWSPAAAAQAGRVTALEGEAVRTARSGEVTALVPGAAVELGDRVSVKGGVLQLDLADGSRIALSAPARLEIVAADFDGRQRRRFTARLLAGSLWAHVAKGAPAGSFEVHTDLAAVQVRGTIFRVDADAVVTAPKGRGRRVSLVRVLQGVVAVRPTAAVGARSTSARAAQPRTEVPGPQAISADEWEARFVTLQQGRQLTVGDDLFEEAQVVEAAQRDALSAWLEKHP